MNTRKHVHEGIFPVEAKRVFALLHTPSAICKWWGAARAIVMPEIGGIWAAAWGPDEDDPEYITVATIRAFEPHCRIVLGDYRYRARTGALPFVAEFETTFQVLSHPDGTLLRVTQDGFPAGPEADEFFAGCQTGWRDTFEGIARFLSLDDREEKR